MVGNTPTPDIDASDVRPHVLRPGDEESDDIIADHYAKVDDDAHLDTVLDTLDTLATNGIEDKRKLVAFGKRMSTLIYHGGLTPSAAKAHAAEDLFRSGRSKQDLADLLGITRGGFNKLSRNAGGDKLDASRLHYMTFDVPMNLVFDETIAAEPPADYETRYVVLEVVNPRLEDEQYHTYTSRRPDTKLAPREPQYALVREEHTPGQGDWADDDPVERSFGTFCDMSIEWYMDAEELVDALYDDRYFFSEDRAEVWKHLLEEYGFTVDSDPCERLDPDVLMERSDD